MHIFDIQIYVSCSTHAKKVTKPLSNERPKSFNQVGALLLDIMGTLDNPIILHTITVVLNSVIQKVCIGKQAELINRTISKAQSAL